jgi:hypothetical protein
VSWAFTSQRRCIHVTPSRIDYCQAELLVNSSRSNRRGAKVRGLAELCLLHVSFPLQVQSPSISPHSCGVFLVLHRVVNYFILPLPFFLRRSEAWRNLFPSPVKRRPGVDRKKSDEYHHAIRALPSSLVIEQGSAMSTPLRRHWRTVGCGHLRSDAPKLARRRADIIDFHYCVTCI